MELCPELRTLKAGEPLHSKTVPSLRHVITRAPCTHAHSAINFEVCVCLFVSLCPIACAYAGVGVCTWRCETSVLLRVGRE